MTRLFSSVLAALAAGAALSWAVLSPSVGIDDANITMNYAENLARGHGFVYVVGGERVEGSTSALWTAITTLLYLAFDRVEPAMTVLGFAITAAILWTSAEIARLLSRTLGQQGALWPALVPPAFLLFPGFFAWTVWSLMDIGLFILLVSLAMLALMRRLAQSGGEAGGAGWLFLVAAGPLVAVRPEGIAVTLGLSLMLAFFGRGRTGGAEARLALATAALGLGLLAGLTLLRLWYFGQPLPNTFYAKVSTSHVAQALQGARYTLRYLLDPVTLPVLALAAGAGIFAWRTPAARACWLATMATGAGAGIVYTMLGGDHFGSFRFYQVLLPLVLPFTLLALDALVRGLRWRMLAAGLAALALFGLAQGRFAATRGHMWTEFRLAEDSRKIGATLATLGTRPSVGILVAGGIAMTYDGPILDLLGLNWVEMAHGDRARVGLKNNSRFSAEVFFRNLPDIVLPEWRSCELPPMDYRLFMDDVVDSPRFRETYAYACLGGVTFFLRRGLDLPGVVIRG